MPQLTKCTLWRFLLVGLIVILIIYTSVLLKQNCNICLGVAILLLSYRVQSSYAVCLRTQFSNGHNKMFPSYKINKHYCPI